MGKKMNFLFPFKSSSRTPAPSSWPWPSACTTAKTLSFRATHEEDDVFKTIINSAYFEPSNVSNEIVGTPISCFNGSSVFEESFSTAPEIIVEEEDCCIERMIRGLRSERLFFEPENKTIVEECSSPTPIFKESSAIAVDSMDPFGDFKKSMVEMVEAHGLKDWECLQELLTCYLKVNNKSNHGYIIGAFVDLLVALAFANAASSGTTLSCSNSHDLLQCSSSSSTTHSFTSPLSFSSSSTFSNSPCLSSLDVDDEKSVNNVVTSSSSLISSS